jgi:hypothetical protein
MISNSHFTAIKNGTTRQIDESGACKGFPYTIQQNWFYWLTVTGMRFIPIHYFQSGKAIYPFEILPCPSFNHY